MGCGGSKESAPIPAQSQPIGPPPRRKIEETPEEIERKRKEKEIAEHWQGIAREQLPPPFPSKPTFEKGGSEDLYKVYMKQKYEWEEWENKVILLGRKLRAASEQQGSPQQTTTTNNPSSSSIQTTIHQSPTTTTQNKDRELELQRQEKLRQQQQQEQLRQQQQQQKQQNQQDQFKLEQARQEMARQQEIERQKQDFIRQQQLRDQQEQQRRQIEMQQRQVSQSPYTKENVPTRGSLLPPLPQQAKEALATFKELYQDGLITESEYKEKTVEILNMYM